MLRFVERQSLLSLPYFELIRELCNPIFGQRLKPIQMDTIYPHEKIMPTNHETEPRNSKPFALVPITKKIIKGSSICAFSKKFLKAENIAKYGSITQQAFCLVQSPCAGQQPYTNNMCHTEQQAMQPPQKMQLSMELPTQADEKIPAQHGHGTFYVESFADYVRRWPECYS